MGLNRETPARDALYQNVQYIKANIAFGDNGKAIVVGVLPAGAVILKATSGVAVTAAFDAGTTNTLNVGTDADADLFGTLLALGTTTFVPLDESIGGYVLTEDTTITATVVLTGTAATAGAGVVYVAYLPAN
jgi:hypothetical protein